MTITAQQDASLIEWATELLKTSALPEARGFEQIWLVDSTGICFTSRPPPGGRRNAKTALIKSDRHGQRVYRVVDGWDLIPPQTHNIRKGEN